jgi:hypothetical protein
MQGIPKMYCVTAQDMSGRQFYNAQVIAPSAKSAVNYFLKSYGCRKVKTTVTKNAYVNKPSELFVFVDLLGGAQEQRTFYKADTDRAWV